MSESFKVNFAEYTRLIEDLSGKKISDLIKSPGSLASCTALCDCHGRYCGCYGSVSARDRFDTVINPADYMQLRDAMIADLRERLAKLEAPIK